MKNLKVEKKDFLNVLIETLNDHLKDDQSPVVVFSSVWSFFNEMEQKNQKGVDQILDIIFEATKGRVLLMPTFSRGYVDGVANLDLDPSSTGVLSETFRKRDGVRRTLSGFFSFAIYNALNDTIVDVIADQAWGKGSVYEWMEKHNATFLMLGTHPTHCSYLHRLEYLLQDKINYRYDKKFFGKIIRDGKSIDTVETLFVRSYDPPAINDFTVLMPQLLEADMKQTTINGVVISSYKTNPVKEIVLRDLEKDPWLVLKNRADYEGRKT